MALGPIYGEQAAVRRTDPSAADLSMIGNFTVHRCTWECWGEITQNNELEAYSRQQGRFYVHTLPRRVLIAPARRS